MKTKNFLLTFVLIGTIALNVDAQQIPNSGFENWSMKIINEPNGFSTSNMRVSTDTGNVTKVTDSYHGLFAAKLETVLSGNQTISGMLLIGTPGNQSINGGVPFTETPDSISGYVKYNIQPNDTAFFIVIFKKNGTIIGQPAIATFTGSQLDYKRFSIPTYLSASNPPDSLATIITSSNMDPPQMVGSTLTIDSISFLNSSEQYPNGDFENWTAVNSGENPESWSSYNNFIINGIPEMSFKTTDAHSGVFGLRLISLTAVVPPPFGTGVTDTLAGYVFLGASNMDNPGISFTDRPISMQAFVKGTIFTGSEAYIMATLRKWNNTTHVRDEVAFTMYSTGSSIPDYTQISTAFNYSMPDTPDTLEIVVMAGNLGPGGIIMPGNEFFIDDISFTFPVGIDETIKDSKHSINIFPNPTSGKVTVSSSEKINVIELYNLLGEKVFMISNFNQITTNELDFSDFQKGIYFMRICNGAKIYTEKVVIH
ncbi:MAG: T9SS type A sorting domain-containing protein [Bacteroidales bacterium]|jgi:hypothetical protein